MLFKGVQIGVVVKGAITPALFEGTQAQNILPSVLPKESFDGASIVLGLSRVITGRDFSGITAQSVLPQSLSFLEGVKTSTDMTRVVMPDVFSGISVTQQLSKALTKNDFRGVVSKQVLPPAKPTVSFDGAGSLAGFRETANEVLFGGASAETRIMVVFPQGSQVIPGYHLGVPLGTDRPLIEPRIHTNGKEEYSSSEDAPTRS